MSKEETKPFSKDVQRCNQNLMLHEQMYNANNEKLGSFLKMDETAKNELVIEFLRSTMQHDKEMKRLWGVVRDAFKVIEGNRAEQTERYQTFLKNYKND